MSSIAEWVFLPTYSLNPNDRIYDTFNPAIHLAGQLQRYAQLCGDSALKALLQERADTIVHIAWRHVQRSEAGHLWWIYSDHRPQPNDLLHVAYICEGLEEYRHAGGRIALDPVGYMGHFAEFRKGGEWYEYVDWHHPHKRPNALRLWSLSMALALLAEDTTYAEHVPSMVAQLGRYRTPEGHMTLRTTDQRVLVRQEAHALLWLSHYLYR